MDSKKKAFFTRKLLLWNRIENKREMPWKGEKDPYRIWLSEVILQQTRVEQGMDYYKRFIKKYPTVQQLAKAPEQEIFKMWEGLGYYNRCKNLIATAKILSDEHSGIFPSDYTSVIKLKGIGPYTASAILSFAFNQPFAVVDGNVERILARYSGSAIAVDSTKGKTFFSTLAASLLDTENPAQYNQAIMDFGATVCKPAQPDCISCVLKKQCTAFLSDKVEVLPVKEKKQQKKHRWLNYFVVEYKNSICVRKRSLPDIWQNLHEFIMVSEGKIPGNTKIFVRKGLKELSLKKSEFIGISEEYNQILTHQVIHCRFIHIRCNEKPILENYLLIEKENLNKLAFPVMFNKYLNDFLSENCED